MDNHYAGLIWTKHALQRLAERQFSQMQAGQAYTMADQIKIGKKSNTQEYVKRFGDQTVTLIVGVNDQGEKIVVSAWIDPPLPGTKDFWQKQRYRQYHQSSTWKKIWLIIKEQLGF